MFRYLLAAQKCVYVQFGHHPPPSLLLSHLISTLNITFSRDSEVFFSCSPTSFFSEKSVISHLHDAETPSEAAHCSQNIFQ